MSSLDVTFMMFLADVGEMFRMLKRVRDVLRSRLEFATVYAPMVDLRPNGPAAYPFLPAVFG